MTEDQKMQMAHDCAMKLVGNPTTPLKDLDSIVDACWKYVDAMQAELVKRGRQRINEALEIHKAMHPNGSVHFDDVPEAILEAERR